MNPHSMTLWDDHAAPRRYPTLRGPLETDVVVIGGGITGTTAALRLAEAGRRVVLIEGRTLCSGASASTTAHGTAALDTPYHVLCSRLGLEATRLVAASSLAAIEHIAARVDKLSISCDLARVPGYLYTEHPAQLDALREELEAARAAGLRVDACAQLAVPFEIAGALIFPDQLRFDPRRYVRGLGEALAAREVAVFEHTRAVEIVEGDRVLVHTDEGGPVQADAALCATHVPLDRATLQTRLRHQQTYAAAFREIDLPDALLWDTERPYHYLRTATVQGVRYLVAGGADHPTGADEHTEIAFERLLAYCRSRFGTDRPDFHWSSQIVESVDGLPYLGRAPGWTRVYVVTGLGGNGTTLGTAGALLVADLILGRRSAWTALYAPERIPAVGETALREVAVASLSYIGAPDVESTAQIERDQGRTLLRDEERIAVYRDPQGALHAVSAVCTHMGCLVRFNDAERTWDCPCHGSRYSIDGAVLEGPAVHALAPRVVVDDAPADETKRDVGS